MELTYWEKQIKGLKQTCATNPKGLKVRYENEHKICSIYKNGTLMIKIHFAQPIKYLSIFQTAMLINVFIDKKKPIDYANYHKCEVGRGFIQNIESLYINESITKTTNRLKEI